MNATERFLERVEGIRRVGDGRWVARCPAHDDRMPSLSIRRADDRVLVHDHAGCDIATILESIGLATADLFDESHTRPDTELQRKALAKRGLEQWCSQKLTENCRLLRSLDRHAAVAVELLDFYEKTGTGTDEERDAAWDRLAFAYHEITWLEFDHERLNSKNRTDHLAVWREHQEVANAAA